MVSVSSVRLLQPQPLLRVLLRHRLPGTRRGGEGQEMRFHHLLSSLPLLGVVGWAISEVLQLPGGRFVVPSANVWTINALGQWLSFSDSDHSEKYATALYISDFQPVSRKDL